MSAFTGVPAWISCALRLLHLDVPTVPQICQRRQISFSLPHFSVSLGILVILGLSTNHPFPKHPTAELLPNSDYSYFTSLSALFSSPPLNPLTPIRTSMSTGYGKLLQLLILSASLFPPYSVNTSDAYKISCLLLHDLTTTTTDSCIRASNRTQHWIARQDINGSDCCFWQMDLLSLYKKSQGKR